MIIKVFQFLLIFTVIWPSSVFAMSAIPEGDKLKFQILRDGQPFGYHIIHFEASEDTVKADIEINMKVGLAFVTLFRYEHENTEVWKNGQLHSITAKTNDDGKKFHVNAQKKDEKIHISGSGGDYVADSDITASTYWNKDMLKSDKILNTQKGQLKDVEVRHLGVDEVEVGGEVVPANHYVVKLPKRDIHAWYHTETDQWVDLKFDIRGSQIDYKRLTPIVKTSGGS